MFNSIPSKTLRRAPIVSILVSVSLLSTNLFGPTGSAERTGKSQTVPGAMSPPNSWRSTYGVEQVLIVRPDADWEFDVTAHVHHYG